MFEKVVKKKKKKSTKWTGSHVASPDSVPNRNPPGQVPPEGCALSVTLDCEHLSRKPSWTHF